MSFIWPFTAMPDSKPTPEAQRDMFAVERELQKRGEQKTVIVDGVEYIHKDFSKAIAVSLSYESWRSAARFGSRDLAVAAFTSLVWLFIIEHWLSK